MSGYDNALGSLPPIDLSTLSYDVCIIAKSLIIGVILAGRSSLSNNKKERNMDFNTDGVMAGAGLRMAVQWKGWS